MMLTEFVVRVFVALNAFCAILNRIDFFSELQLVKEKAEARLQTHTHTHT